MLKVSVSEYAKNPALHQIAGKNSVPKPTIFKQIKENRLPPNVEVEEIGGFYILTIHQPGDVWELVAPVHGEPGRTRVVTSGPRDKMESLAESLNFGYDVQPYSTREKQF